MFNSEQKSYMKYLNSVPAAEKCWCGWSLLGKCFDCSRDEIVIKLTSEDKSKLKCNLCGNAPHRPETKLVHLRNCPDSEAKLE